MKPLINAISLGDNCWSFDPEGEKLRRSYQSQASTFRRFGQMSRLNAT